MSYQNHKIFIWLKFFENFYILKNEISLIRHYEYFKSNFFINKQNSKIVNLIFF